MVNKSICILLTIAAIVFNTVPRWLPYDNINWCKDLYYQGQALSYLLLLIAARYKPRDILCDIILELTMWLAVSNVLDEFFFDPRHYGHNETAFAILMLVHAIYKYRKYKRIQIDYPRNYKH